MTIKIDNNFLNLEFKKMSQEKFVKKLKKDLFYCINPKNNYGKGQRSVKRTNYNS